jgi:SAM-dependent methyltransferase
VFKSLEGAMNVFTIYIGDQLGFYEVLANDGGLTAAQLAARTGTHERYVREWLEQQAVARIVVCENPAAPADERLFHLPAGHDEVLADRDSLDYVAPIAQVFAGAVSPLADVLNAFRSGGGVPYGDYGKDLLNGQARINRSAFLYQLGQEWLPSIPDLHKRLASGSDVRVADIGCGAGYSSIGIAQNYPNVQVDGFDLDQPSVELARANAIDANVADRVHFQVRDAGDRELSGRYDLVIALECIHDMSDPVSALSAMRRMVNDGGTVLVVDERVGETFMGGDTEVDWMMYGWSVLHCLPVGMADHHSAGTGTVMRPDTLRRYAIDAGFSDLEVLPIDTFFFRFYRLSVDS